MIKNFLKTFISYILCNVFYWGIKYAKNAAWKLPLPTIQFNSFFLLSNKAPITEQYNRMKNIYIKKGDIMISMIIKLTCNDKNL
jgi:hypothetical protein